MLGEGGHHPEVDAHPQPPISFVPRPPQPQPQFHLPWSPVSCVLLYGQCSPMPTIL